MATTNGIVSSVNVNDRDGLSSGTVKEVAPTPSSEVQRENTEMKARADALWEQMNKGISNKSLKAFPNKPCSTVNRNSHKTSDNWMTYLGLGAKKAGPLGQDVPQKGPGVMQNGTSDEATQPEGIKAPVDAVRDQMNSGISNKGLESFSSSSSSSTNTTSQTTSANWMMYLGLAPKNRESLGHAVPQQRPSVIQNETSDEAKRIAAAALSAVKDAAAAAAAASGRGKVEITEVRDFAGQEIEYKKLVDADSKEASEKGKAPATSAVDAVLEQIRKKQKLSVLDKSKKDWGEFKEENKGMGNELDAYKKSSNQYLEKVSFLQRADFREFERERDARLALQARRKPDMREEP